MASRWQNATDGSSFRFFSPEQVDEILYEGAKRGRAGSHAAIERILKVESGLERAELWLRIRQLKDPPREISSGRVIWSADDDRVLSTGYAGGWAGKRQAVRELLKRHPDWRPHVVWTRAARLGLAGTSSKRGEERSHCSWSEDDDQVLLNLAGYKDCRVIAKVLHRSESAVRGHLATVGKSGRVDRDGYSRRALAADLHFGIRTVQRLIADGMLEVRDPRITRKSLDDLQRSGRLSKIAGNGAVRPGAVPNGALDEGDPGHDSAVTLTTQTKACRAKRVWAEVAAGLKVGTETIQKLIAQGVLKLYDPRITEKSLRELCRRQGALINYAFLNRETQEWLRSTLGFRPGPDGVSTTVLVKSRKHAGVVRKCGKCGRAIRGNVFFRKICVDGKPHAESISGLREFGGPD